jgi:hypothetical protein
MLPLALSLTEPHEHCVFPPPEVVMDSQRAAIPSSLRACGCRSNRLFPTSRALSVLPSTEFADRFAIDEQARCIGQRVPVVDGRLPMPHFGGEGERLSRVDNASGRFVIGWWPSALAEPSLFIHLRREMRLASPSLAVRAQPRSWWRPPL